MAIIAGIRTASSVYKISTLASVDYQLSYLCLGHQVTDRRSSALEGIQVLLDGVYVLLTVHIEKSRVFFWRDIELRRGEAA